MAESNASKLANNILTDGKFDATDVVGTLAGFTSTGIDDNATSTAITIDSSEHVGINTTTTTYALNIANGAGNMRIKTTDSANVANASTSILEYHGTDNRAGYVGFVGGDMFIHTDTYSAGDIKLNTNGSERVRIHGVGGVMSAVNGIALGVGTANTASNVLDHYETGTWTPTVATGTVDSSRNRYERIGNVVILSAELTNFSDTTSSNAIFVQNFPFTPASTNNVYEGVARTSNSVKVNSSVLTFGSLQFYEDSSRRLHSSIDSSGVIYYFSLIYTTNA